MDVLRICCVIPTNFIGQFLVIADSEPAFLCIGCAVFQQVVKIFDIRLSEFTLRVVYDVVYGPEMIRSSASHWWRHHVDASVTRAMGSHREWDIAEGAEWLPYAMMLGAGYIGGDARAGIVDRALLTATSFVILEAVRYPRSRH